MVFTPEAAELTNMVQVTKDDNTVTARLANELIQIDRQVPAVTDNVKVAD